MRRRRIRRKRDQINRRGSRRRKGRRRRRIRMKRHEINRRMSIRIRRRTRGGGDKEECEGG